MWSSFFLLLSAGLGAAIAGSTESSVPQSTEWVDWSTSTVYSTVQNTVTNYVTLTGPTTTQTEFKTITQVNTVSVTGPTTTETRFGTITQVNTITQTSTVTITPAPTTVTSVQTIPQTVEETLQRTATVTISAATVTVTATVSQTVQNSVVRTSIVESIATVQQTATVNNVITATITSISRITQVVSGSASCPSVTLSGLVTCPSRIINPTYTPPTPLPSNYLWGCPPGKLCHPKREGCNFEQNLPADTYVCAPEECLPVVGLPSLDAFLAANQQSNDSCAWLTPIDDYFNLNPLSFGLDFGIFNIYGQATCTSTCAPPSTVTVGASSNWGAWLGPAPTSAAGHSSAAPPQVTKRAELADKKLMKRQGAPLIAYMSCYALCDYAAAVYMSVALDPPALCDPNGDWFAAYDVATNCNIDYAGYGGPSSILTEFDMPRSICNSYLQKRSIRGRRP